MDIWNIVGVLFLSSIGGMAVFLGYLVIRSAKAEAEHHAEKKARKKEKKRLKKLALANSQTESPSA